MFGHVDWIGVCCFRCIIFAFLSGVEGPRALRAYTRGKDGIGVIGKVLSGLYYIHGISRVRALEPTWAIDRKHVNYDSLLKYMALGSLCAIKVSLRSCLT